MKVTNWDGKIEDTEITSDIAEDISVVKSAPSLDYGVCVEDIKADKVDCLIAASSGIITSALDTLWVGEFSLMDAQNIGTDYINKFVISFAQSHEPPALLVVCCWPYWADVTFPPKGGPANHYPVIFLPKGSSINHYLVTDGRLKAALCHFPESPSIRSLSYCSPMYLLIVSSFTLPTVSQ